MKKLSVIIIALTLVLGLSQCKKQTATTTEGEKVYITVNVADDGAKYDVYPGTGAYVFTNGDKLYVGNNGQYIGTLTYNRVREMNEIITRTVSGIVFVSIIVACVLLSPWICAALLFVIVGFGTFEMWRLHGIKEARYRILSELYSLGAYVVAAMVALHFLPMKWLLLELLFLMLPFLFALFSKKYDHKILFSTLYASLAFLSLPCALMLFMYRSDLFGPMAGAHLILLVFGLLWVNDIFLCT